MTNNLLFLGTGASMGVPVIGCKCVVCQSGSKFNRRLRPSVLLCVNEKFLLVDAGPDFRQQALRHDIRALDGLLLTHAHHDHTAGLDDLRAVYYKRKNPLPILLSKATSKDIQERFHYLFLPNPYLPEKGSQLVMQELSDKQGTVLFEGIKINYMTYLQGGMEVNGFRFGNLAYLSDIKIFDDSMFASLKGTKILIISALRFTSSPLHFSVDEAVDFSYRVGADEVWITHISHDLDHKKANAYLPRHIKLAFDGLKLNFG